MDLLVTMDNVDVKSQWKDHDKSTIDDYFQYVLSITKPTTFIYMGPEEFELGQGNEQHIGLLNEVDEHLEKHNQTITYVTGRSALPRVPFKEAKKNMDFVYNMQLMKNIKVVLSPLYLFTDGLFRYIYSEFTSYKHENITKAFVSMNSKPHYHRCVLMDQLAKHNLVDTNVVTWLFTDPEFVWNYWEQRRISKENFKMYNSEYAPLLPDCYVDFDPIVISRTLPLDYFNTLLQVVPETNADCLFYTEKTALPLLLKKPFVIYGVSGINKHLTKYGFELYDEIIDYSFDSITDLYTRSNLLALQLAELNDRPEDFQQLFDSVQEKCEHNFNVLRDIVTTNRYIPDIVTTYYGDHLNSILPSIQEFYNNKK